MFRFMALTMLALLAGVICMILVNHYPAHVLIDLGDEYLRFSLYALLFLMALVLLIVFFSQRFLRDLGRVPGNLLGRWSKSSVQRARDRLLRGLADLEQGDWLGAARHLEPYSAPGGYECLLRCLGAARASWRRGRMEDCERFLSRARNCCPEADLYIGVLRARIHISEGRWEQADTLLKQLDKQYPDKIYLRELLLESSLALNDWRAALFHLSRLRWPRERHDRVSIQAFRQCFDEAVRQDTPQAMEQAWRALPRRLARTPELLEIYTRAQMHFGGDGTCEAPLRAALRRTVNPELVRLYARLDGADAEKQLAFLEGLLRDNPRQPALLEATGMLCARLKFWGRACSLYEAALGIQPTPRLYLELADVLKRQKDSGRVLECYRRGLETAVRDGADAAQAASRDLEAPSSAA